MWDEAWDPREIVLEHGLALDELVQDQAPRRGTRRGRWASIAVHRRCSMERYHRRNSPTVEAWLHAGRVMFLGKLGRTAAAADVLLREHGRGQGVWWGANATHPWRSWDAVPHHRRKSLMMEAWLHTGRVIFLRNSWEVRQQPKSYDGSMIVVKEFGGRLT